MERIVLLLIGVLGSVEGAFAQPPPPPPPNPAISLDVVVSLLLLTAVAYAIYNFRIKRAEERN